MNITIQTSDPKRHVLVTKSAISVVDARQPTTSFNLTNTLRPAAMAEARQVAREAGIKLANVKRIAVSF